MFPLVGGGHLGGDGRPVHAPDAAFGKLITRARAHMTGVDTSSSFLQDHDQEAAAAAAATAAAAAAAAAAAGATTRITCSYRSSPCLPSRRSRDRDRFDFNDSDPSSTTEDCHQNENMIPGTTCTTFPPQAPTPPSPLRRHQPIAPPQKKTLRTLNRGH